MSANLGKIRTRFRTSWYLITCVNCKDLANALLDDKLRFSCAIASALSSRVWKITTLGIGGGVLRLTPRRHGIWSLTFQSKSRWRIKIFDKFSRYRWSTKLSLNTEGLLMLLCVYLHVLTKHFQHFGEHMIKFCEYFEFGTSERNVNLKTAKWKFVCKTSASIHSRTSPSKCFPCFPSKKRFLVFCLYFDIPEISKSKYKVRPWLSGLTYPPTHGPPPPGQEKVPTGMFHFQELQYVLVDKRALRSHSLSLKELSVWSSDTSRCGEICRVGIDLLCHLAPQSFFSLN